MLTGKVLKDEGISDDSVIDTRCTDDTRHLVLCLAATHIGAYSRIRTLGSSAGGYMAVIVGYHLGAEMTVSIGGRFPAERHPVRILKMVLTTWRAKRIGNNTRVIMSYDADKTRDRNYARIIAGLCGGSLLAVEVTNEKVGHRIFECLVERGELAPYLARTIFAEMNDELITTEQANAIMDFPTTRIRSFGSYT